MSHDGPWARFQRLIATTDAVANGSLTRHILDRAAGTVSGLARKGFDTSKDPAGEPWRRLKRPRPRSRPNRGGPLYDSGDLRFQASRARIEGDAIVVHVAHPGATAHFYGTRRIPVRRYLPRGSLSVLWRVALEGDADELFRTMYLR